MIITVACVIVLHHAAHTAAAGVPDRIREARERTHECQRQLGVPLTPVSSTPVRGAAYQRWVLGLWQARAAVVCAVVAAANRDPRVAVKVAFGPARYAEAIRVAWCESRLDPGARNGQYQGTWQMGEWERSTYGHGDTPLEQGLAARRYFDAAGWGPWECARITGVL